VAAETGLEAAAGSAEMEREEAMAEEAAAAAAAMAVAQAVEKEMVVALEAADPAQCRIPARR
jgi:hypothetical protein